MRRPVLMMALAGVFACGDNELSGTDAGLDANDVDALDAGDAGVEVQTWTRVIGDGFGQPSQTTVPEMEVFEGYLYAATASTIPGPNLARLWRSTSGDEGTWSPVTGFQPPLLGDRSIHSFGTTDLDGGIIWLGTGNPGQGAMIYRSVDGEAWTGITPRGFGKSMLTGAAPHMVVFRGTGDTEPYIYAGMGSHGGGTPGQVWRAPISNTDPQSWEQLIDFADVDTSVDTITYFHEWNETLYFGTNGGGQLWQTTDGSQFTKNTFVGDGFGDPTNFVLSSFTVFDDHFYVTTTNHTGGQLWRTADGEQWERITSDAFGKGDAVSELRSLRVSFDQLWLTAYTNTERSNGTPIWVSTDGVDFEQSNEDGFGNPNNNGQNAVTIGFGDHQYFGGPNYAEGGQIWRVAVNPASSE